MEENNNSAFANGSTSFTTEDSGLFRISKEGYESFAFVSNIITTPILCVFGILGNSLGLGVLWKDTKEQRLSIYFYLCVLTLFDNMYLFVGLLRSIPHVIHLYDEQLANYTEEHMKLGTIYVDMVLAHTSHAIIIVMSMERLLALKCPFTVKHFWISRYPKCLILVCFIINVIFLIPYPLYFEVASYDQDNTTIYYLQFQNEAEATMDTYMLIQTFVDYVIPVCVVFFINVAIPIVYSREMRQRREMFNMTMQGLNSQQTKITTTVFCITLMYFLLSLPNVFIKILAFTDDGYSFDGKYKLSFWFFIDISNLFSYINAANDFVIYILVSDHSRQMFIDMYCWCSHRSQEQQDLHSVDECKDISNTLSTTFTDRY